MKNIKYTEEFKEQALKLAERTSVPEAARQLNLHASQIYGWRKNLRKDSASVREADLAAENARLKRLLAEQAEELEIVKKAATYFAKHLK